MTQKTKRVKLKTVTVKELRIINQNSIDAELNRVFDIDELIADGTLLDDKDYAYPVQLCMHHKNFAGTRSPRVYMNSELGKNSLIMDMTYEDYDQLFKMSFKVVA